MSRLPFACLLLCLALDEDTYKGLAHFGEYWPQGSTKLVSQVVDAQQAERTTGSDITDEEPHPYTISFFLFPRQQTVELDGKKKSKNTTEHVKSNSTQAKGKHSSTDPQNDDTDVSYQHGSIKHPAHEMYPMCHHCPKNSSYEECVHKRTLKRCDNGLSNICFTKSTKRDNIVHYHMGCANHRQCQKARANPCKAHEKRCFTCCQWSGCNSMSHHGDDATAFSLWGAGHVTTIGWGSLGVSLLTFIMMYFI